MPHCQWRKDSQGNKWCSSQGWELILFKTFSASNHEKAATEKQGDSNHFKVAVGWQVEPSYFINDLAFTLLRVTGSWEIKRDEF